MIKKIIVVPQVTGEHNEVASIARCAQDKETAVTSNLKTVANLVAAGAKKIVIYGGSGGRYFRNTKLTYEAIRKQNPGVKIRCIDLMPWGIKGQIFPKIGKSGPALIIEAFKR